MPLKFWDEASSTAMFLINRLPSKVINDETPFERLFGTQLDYNFLCMFRGAVWPNLKTYNSRKLEYHSKKCVFIGYSDMHKGFKCLDPKEGHVYISRDVVFDETIFPFASLHPNAGAHLRSEIALLPDILKKILCLFLGTQICKTNMSYLLPILTYHLVLLMLWIKF
jgi:histone deacetylase 1/2